MKKQFKIIVAHPDDEIIFFSSILKSKSRKIICFSVSKDKKVNKGREVIQTKAPFKNWLFLNQKELSAYNFKGCSTYIKTFHKLKSLLSEIIEVGDTIYTHNPWGEYGHEDHILVFDVINNLSKKLKLKIYVNGYVTNNTYNLMSKKEYLLSNNFKFKKIDHKFNSIIKKKYILNSCWTFDKNYKWPETEIFFNINNKNKYKKINTSSPTLNFMLDNYKISFLKKFVIFLLPNFATNIIKKCWSKLFKKQFSSEF